MAPIEKTLAALSTVAKRLNERTESLNATFSSVEKQLQDAQTGIPIWLGCALDLDERTGEGWDLGFCKLGDHWRLAVKRVQGSKSEWKDVDAPIALLAAPRLVRVEAAPQIEVLVGALTAKVATYLAGIEAADKAARK